jgi:hypothetical protein
MTEPRVAVLILKAENWLSDIFKSLGEKSSRSCSLQHRSKLGSVLHSALQRQTRISASLNVRSDGRGILRSHPQRTSALHPLCRNVHSAASVTISSWRRMARTAHCCRSRLPQHAAVRPVEAAIRCSCFVMEISKNRCVGLAVLDDADPALDRDRIRILEVYQSD